MPDIKTRTALAACIAGRLRSTRGPPLAIADRAARDGPPLPLLCLWSYHPQLPRRADESKPPAAGTSGGSDPPHEPPLLKRTDAAARGSATALVATPAVQGCREGRCGAIPLATTVAVEVVSQAEMPAVHRCRMCSASSYDYGQSDKELRQVQSAPMTKAVAMKGIETSASN